MPRQLTTRIYIFSFLASLLIFSFGLTIGLLIEKERLQTIERISLEKEVNLKSLQLQQSYIKDGNVNCEALNTILGSNIKTLSDAMDKVIDYNKRGIIDSEDFRLQLQNYFLTEIQFFLLTKEVKERCQTDAVTILYFHNEEIQNTQGYVLDYLKTIFGSKLMVFSFDVNFQEEPMVSVLLKTYSITQFPSIVVDDKLYSGGATRDELFSYLCQRIKDIPKECDPFLEK